MPNPFGGLIKLRNQTEGPKMYRVFDGWHRPVRERNADNRVLLRPSLPTARSFKRSSDKALRNSRMGATSG